VGRLVSTKWRVSDPSGYGGPGGTVVVVGSGVAAGETGTVRAAAVVAGRVGSAGLRGPVLGDEFTEAGAATG
jgi:hypothetical protein